ncbi:hypothetical protein GA0070609_0995 [Micromonospora echinaurantiaca]|uniref:Uncharacterized protein n=1 Tax=Micromonospora echinaurantiaca TaxID=47857 RepID=A0A1C5H6Y3_9ACTN|nr:hypothetical protein [Micromonospora echinaurantiaca]SCG41201.1 hypothetical protein GA0070609_0995 [Micromonospora echinaurantiaca]
MLIDCAGCGIRGSGCSDCLVTALLDDSSPAAGLGGAEARAVEVFARAGFEVEVLAAPRSRRPARRRRVA